MTQVQRFIFIISFFVALPMVTAQEKIDTLKITQITGLRLGVDIIQPIFCSGRLVPIIKVDHLGRRC